SKAGATGNADVLAALAAFGDRLAALEKDLVRLSGRFSGLFSAVSSGDAGPTAQALSEFKELRSAHDKWIEQWKATRTVERSAVNEKLKAAGLPAIEIER
ncbi:MAG TPA: hypothetical protein VIY96_02765, partial [Thermoanaerobaculia bacterium]